MVANFREPHCFRGERERSKIKRKLNLPLKSFVLHTSSIERAQLERSLSRKGKVNLIKTPPKRRPKRCGAEKMSEKLLKNYLIEAMPASRGEQLKTLQ